LFNEKNVCVMNGSFEIMNALFTLVGGGALGGLVMNVVNRKENRRIKQSEADESVAHARLEDASAAKEIMSLLERTVVHMERMNAYNESNSERLMKMFEKEMSMRLESDRYYCSASECDLREPPLGTFRRDAKVEKDAGKMLQNVAKKSRVRQLPERVTEDFSEKA
jgi:hypothetical protein